MPEKGGGVLVFFGNREGVSERGGGLERCLSGGDPFFWGGGGIRVKQVRFGKLALPQLNGSFFGPKKCDFRPFCTTFSMKKFGPALCEQWSTCTFGLLKYFLGRGGSSHQAVAEEHLRGDSAMAWSGTVHIWIDRWMPFPPDFRNTQKIYFCRN